MIHRYPLLRNGHRSNGLFYSAVARASLPRAVRAMRSCLATRRGSARMDLTTDARQVRLLVTAASM
jgi:hypothetical protein